MLYICKFLSTNTMTPFKLRAWQLSDIDSLTKYANNPNIAKWLTDQFPYPYDKQAAETYIKMVANDHPQKVFAIEIDGEAVGSIGIFPQTDIHQKSAEIGYWLSEDYWHQGIMPRAVNEIVAYGFLTFDMVRIYALPLSTNKDSLRVFEKSLSTLEARLTNALYKQDSFLDEYIYSKLKP